MSDIRKRTLCLITVLGTFVLSSCSASINYLKEKINPDEPATLIGYQTMTLRENTPPEAIIDFATNSWELDEQAYSRIASLISENRTYLVEGTAGGLTGPALNLSRKRTKAVISQLEAQGIQPKRIFIVDYDPQQAGRQVRVYTITRQIR